MLNRRFIQERFSLSEIMVILESGLKGLGFLEELGCVPRALNTGQIMINRQRGVIINDPLLSVGCILPSGRQPAGESNFGKIFSIPLQQYPSPEKLLFLNDLIENYNEWLSEMFTLGVIILEAIFLEPLSELLYDKVHKKIYYHKLKQKI